MSNFKQTYICRTYSIRNISKLAIYAFHYGFMKKIFNDFKLSFTDTDSLY